MVRRSFLARLFGLGEEDGVPAARSAAGTGLERSGGRPAAGFGAPGGDGAAGGGTLDEDTAPDEGPPVQAGSMPPDEELALRLKDDFEGLGSLLTGIDRKIDEQHRHSEELLVEVKRIPELMKDVPDASQAGLRLLATISTILENQGRTTQQLMARMNDLPAAFESLEQKVGDRLAARLESQQQQAAADLERVTDEARRRLGEGVERMERTVAGIEARETEGREQVLAELRRQQTEADRRVTAVLQQSSRTTKLLVFLLVVVIAALLLVVHAVSQG